MISVGHTDICESCKFPLLTEPCKCHLFSEFCDLCLFHESSEPPSFYLVGNTKFRGNSYAMADYSKNSLKIN